MKSTADHLVRGIMDLRKKIHIVQDKLEHEVAVSTKKLILPMRISSSFFLIVAA